MLERYDYLRDGRPTSKAPYLRSLFDTNALTLGELLTNRQLEGLRAGRGGRGVVVVCAWTASHPCAGLPLTRRLHRLREILDALHGGVLREEERHGVQISRPLPVDFHGLALAWAEGRRPGLRSRSGRASRKAIWSARCRRRSTWSGQMRGAALQGPLGTHLVPLLDEADQLLRRGVVEASYRWAVGGLPDADEDEETLAQWDVPVVLDDEPRRQRDRTRSSASPSAAGRGQASPTGSPAPQPRARRRRRP